MLVVSLFFRFLFSKKEISFEEIYEKNLSLITNVVIIDNQLFAKQIINVINLYVAKL